MEEWIRIVFIEILIPILTFVLGIGAKTYSYKRKNKNILKVKASGHGSIAAGRDINGK